MRKSPIVIVVGAGLAGLSCAVRLHEEGVPVQVIESSERVGGRVSSDRHQEYLLDRGFQALLSSYPAAKQILNMQNLNLQPFYPGVQIWWKGKFHKFVMPFAHPLEALQSVTSPIGTLNDKALIVKFRARLLAETTDGIMEKPPGTILECLKKEGFSQTFIDRFWRPLCGAFLLERELATDYRVFEFIMRCYFSGEATLPIGGMQSIAQQLADRLPKGALRFKSPATAIQDGIVSLPQGETLATQAIVVATDPAEAARLLEDTTPLPESRPVTCLYYETENPPFDKSFFVLNGEDSGIVKYLCLPSLASGSYAPEGHTLISVTLLEYNDEEEHELEETVRKHLAEWFKDQVNDWRYLRAYRIRHALPSQTPEVLQRTVPIEIRPGIFRCGDYSGIASINGALESGRKAAEAVLAQLKANVPS